MKVLTKKLKVYPPKPISLIIDRLCILPKNRQPVFFALIWYFDRTHGMHLSGHMECVCQVDVFIFGAELEFDGQNGRQRSFCP